MHEQAGRCVARGVCALALAGVLAGASGGKSGASPNATTTAASEVSTQAATTSPRLTATQRKMASIVKAWSVRLNGNDNMGVAQLYSLPTLIFQSPYEYRLKTRSEVALFFSLLPCAGKVISIAYHGKYATAVFRLGNRGSTPCDDPGALAAARFEIVKGKIVSWSQVAVPAKAATGPQAA